MATSNDITVLLQDWQAGDSAASDELFELVYKELRRIAQKRLSGENRNHTLQATEIVHEIFPQLARQRQPWQNRSQFYALASECMRRFLVDHARARQRQKRGGAEQYRIPLSDLKETEICRVENFEEVLAVDRALEKLGEMDETAAIIIKHRYFGGLAREEIADLLEVSPATVDRAYRSAKAWLRRELAFEFSPYLLHGGQITKPVEFIKNLRSDSANHLARRIGSVLPTELRAAIDRDAENAPELLTSIIEATNKLLLGAPLFPHATIKEITGEAAENLSVEDTIKLNRRLLEAAFPGALTTLF